MTKFINLNYFKLKYGYIHIFLIALVIRVFAIILIPPEFWEQEIIATNILAGKGFIYPHFGNIIYRSYCEPLYPFVAAIVYFLTNHNVFMLGIIQAIFSSAIAVVIYFIARNIYGQAVAYLAGILVALHPGLIIYTTKLHPLTFDAFFFSLTLLMVIRLTNNFNWQNIIISALVSGLCVLSRPTILVFLPFALFYIFKIKKIKLFKALIYMVTFVIFAGVIFLPWTLRNYLIHKQFILTRSGNSYVFWLGNNPNFSGSALNKSGEDIFDLAPQAFKEKIYRLDEISQNKEFLNDALSYIRKFPFQFIERTIKKIYYFWWFSPQAGLLYPKIWLILYKILYIFILTFGISGIYFSCKQGLFRNRSEAMLILLFLLSISTAQSLFYIETRHRWAVEPIILIFSANGINLAWLKLKDIYKRLWIA